MSPPADLTAWRERVEDATASLEKAAAPDTLEATVSTAKAAANDARNAWLAARDAHDRHAHAGQARSSRLKAIEREIAGWEKRSGGAQRESLEARLAQEQVRSADLAEGEIC